MASEVELQRVGIKFFADDSSSVEPRDVIPIFHRWIQTNAIEGHLLVDVADYAHVPDGPGALLVAHEANFSLDQANNRTGLLYHRKQAVEGNFQQRLCAILRATLHGCKLLESDPDLQGRIRFRGEELAFIANDRLHAPNTEDAYKVIVGELSEVMRKIYDGDECAFYRNADPKERLTISVQSARPVSIQTLIDRLEPHS